MAEIRRTSNEEANQDSIRAEQRKVKNSRTQANNPLMLSRSQAGRSSSSRFDELLDQKDEADAALVGKSDSESGAAPMATSANLDAQFQRILQRQEKIFERDEDDSSDKEDSDSSEKVDNSDRGEDKPRGASGHGGKQRVSAKEGSNQSQEFSGKQEGGDSQKSFQEGKEFQLAPTPLASGKTGLSPAPSPFLANKLPGVEAIEMASDPQAPRTLPKAILDQIIQSVTISRDKDLNQEIQIVFQDNFFNGTRLKILSKNGTIKVQFLVPNRAVLASFKNERENLAEALGKKGIDVSDIEVELA